MLAQGWAKTPGIEPSSELKLLESRVSNFKSSNSSFTILESDNSSPLIRTIVLLSLVEASLPRSKLKSFVYLLKFNIFISKKMYCKSLNL